MIERVSVLSKNFPKAGQRVVVWRSNNTWDRGEYSPIYFDGLGAWFMPEGPVPCSSWSEDIDTIIAWGEV